VTRSLLLPLGGALLLVLTGCKSTESNPSSASGSAATTLAAPAAPAPSLPDPVKVELSTSLGKITLALATRKAPGTVANFLSYVRKGHYNGTVFHRVISSFMIQGGGFDTKLVEKPTDTPIQNEADNGLSNERGTVAMARTPNPHSATAQFFINVVDNKKLDHREKTLQGYGYCVFGKVIEGMDVVDKIKAIPTGPKGPFDSDVPTTEVVINEAKVVQ